MTVIAVQLQKQWFDVRWLLQNQHSQHSNVNKEKTQRTSQLGEDLLAVDGSSGRRDSVQWYVSHASADDSLHLWTQAWLWLN